MIDLHTHTILSDGALIPAELVRWAEINGYKAIGLTDHVDSGNMETVLKQLIRFSEDLNELGGIKVLPGIEITHVPPPLIPKSAEQARKSGAKIVVAHGESPVEPVAPKTNWSALQSDVDILAHPGMITEEEVQMAAEKGIYLEVTPRRGHSLTNGRLVNLARKQGAKLVLNTDAHRSGELFTKDLIIKVGLGAGLTEDELQLAFRNSEELVQKRF